MEVLVSECKADMEHRLRDQDNANVLDFAVTFELRSMVAPDPWATLVTTCGNTFNLFRMAVMQVTDLVSGVIVRELCHWTRR